MGSGAIPRGGDAYGSVFHGGSLHARPTDTPPLEYDHHEMLRMFREVIGEAPGLRRFVVHCARESTTAPWTIRNKPVPGAEVDAIAKRRKAVDTRVKAELAPLKTPGVESVVFGRRSHSTEAELLLFREGGPKSLEPTPSLLDLLADADGLYRAAGHELVVGVWSLDRRNGWNVTDHFE